MVTSLGEYHHLILLSTGGSFLRLQSLQEVSVDVDLVAEDDEGVGVAAADDVLQPCDLVLGDDDVAC